MVSALVVFLFVGVLQLALVLHVRNTLIDAAGEGARVAALADEHLGSGVSRTRELVAASISPRYAQEVQAEIVVHDGLEVVVVTVEAPLPVLGLLGPSGSLSVTGRAVNEG